jgi:protein-S-isoprenylcysteine O-methyltransferase Ste14
MKSRFRQLSLWLKLLVFLLFYVGGVAVGIPALLLWWANGRFTLGLGSMRYGGLILMIVGVVLYLACSIQLLLQGQGTPTPLEPTRLLIKSGPYAVVRNPMYLSAALFFSGQAILMDSAILAVYSLLMILVYHFAVIWLEEPALMRRFGALYGAYCTRVPRWLPSIWHAGK